ncbi:hypothetical protein ACFE04_030497 [Oxalis oulophora]
MVTTMIMLQAPSTTTTSFHSTSPKPKILCGNKGRKHREQKKLRELRKLELKNNKNTLSYPPSTLTPLLITHKPYPQSKIQALDSVIDDVASSIEKGITIDVEIFDSLLDTCINFKAFDQGIRVHGLIPKTHLRKHRDIASKVVRFYAMCKRIDTAHRVFDEMYSRNVSAFPWNLLMAGYAELGQYEDAMALYFQMEEEGVEPDRFTFPRALKACGGIGSIQIGEKIFLHAVRLGFANDMFVLNSLVDMYAKCGDILKARSVFDKIDSKDSVSWNIMLTSYIRHGLLIQATEIFRGMFKDGFEADSVAISGILSGFSSLKLVVQIHGWVLRRGIEWSLSIVNSLIVGYSDNNMLDKARWLFHNMPERDIVSWNSIISAHCKDKKVINYFELMESEGILPDSITFVSLLSACAHLGFVEDGERLFSLMRDKYKIGAIKEHYACMVNLYGRAGFIDEAYAIAEEGMGLATGPTVWGALLYACYLHGNVAIGEIAAQKLFELEPDNELNFELLMKLCGKLGRVEDVERVRSMMHDRGLELPQSRAG